MRRAVVAAAVAGVLVLAGCSSQISSAREEAQKAGCSHIQQIVVPSKWANYDQGVSCSLDGATVAVYWSPPAKFAQECTAGSNEQCSAAMQAFQERLSN